MFPTTPYICCYTTLRNLKCHFCHFPTIAATKTYIKIHFFLLVHIIHIIWHILSQHTSDSIGTTWDLLQNNMSAHWACIASVLVSEMADTHVHCSNTQIWIQWTTKFVQKCSRVYPVLLSSRKVVVLEDPPGLVCKSLSLTLSSNFKLLENFRGLHAFLKQWNRVKITDINKSM